MKGGFLGRAQHAIDGRQRSRLDIVQRSAESLLAILNEAVWRNFSTDTWVNFKVWGVMPLTVVFALSQVRLILKHELKPEDPEAKAEHW